MSDSWSQGYVSDIGYTFGYYHELNPARANFALRMQGFAAPKVINACELGFGQGLSINLHAAASGVHWYGTDFNPAHAAFAAELGAASGASVNLADDSFENFAQRSDLPGFDFVGLHGIWSWISDENRNFIVDFLRSKLNVGGVLYVSYNTLPGWAAFAPMRHLLTEHAEVLGAEGRGIVNRINGAIDFADGLLKTQPTFLKANPLVAERVNSLKGHSRHYLAHEYFNRDWHPMYFATMKQWLEAAKLQFACSANLLDSIDAIQLTGEQQKFLQEVPDPMFRETVRDFMVNQQFRRDYWVKGLRRIDQKEQYLQIRSERLVMAVPRSEVQLKAQGALGEASLADSVYSPLFDLMSDGKSRTISEIESVLAPGLSFPQLLQALTVAVGQSILLPAIELEEGSTQQLAASKLNRHLIRRAGGSSDVQYLASVVTGGGIQVNRFQQLFIDSIQSGNQDPALWASDAWRVLSSLGQRIIKDGATLETEKENVAELERQAKVFCNLQANVLGSLGVVDINKFKG